ncbi:MAG: CPBP family intramembrane metalloprotease [Chloroflexi bacterium]|nr:CPBP family intramembrane metalloprotease [Chloroflexota bacterium]
MKKLNDWMKSHQVTAFFLFAYAITWPLLFIYFYVFHGDTTAGALMEPLVVFSPALMAMLISGIVEPQPKQADRKPHRIAFLLSWLVSAPILILYAWKIYKVELVMAAFIYGFLSLFPAWVLSSAYARTPGIRKHFSTLLKPRGSVLWYLVVFLTFPGIPLLGMWITLQFGSEAKFFMAGMAFQDVAFLLLLEFLHVLLMTGGINEESGWRGFALPRLQTRYPVIVSALIVGFFWSMWHLPLDIGTNTPVSQILTNRLFYNLVFSILMAWLYNRTNGSILAPVLFHAAMNAFGDQFSTNIASGALFVSLAIVAIVSDSMWKKLPSAHPAVYQAPVLDG